MNVNKILKFNSKTKIFAILSLVFFVITIIFVFASSAILDVVITETTKFNNNGEPSTTTTISSYPAYYFGLTMKYGRFVTLLLFYIFEIIVTVYVFKLDELITWDQKEKGLLNNKYSLNGLKITNIVFLVFLPPLLFAIKIWFLVVSAKIKAEYKQIHISHENVV